MTRDAVRTDDVQGLVLCRYGDLPAAWFALLAIDDAKAARTWLAGAVAAIRFGRDEPRDTAVNVAFGWEGVQKLSPASGVPAGFSGPFLEGMAAPRRATILGDVGPNAPDGWAWGGAERRSRPHVLVMAYASGEDALTALRARLLPATGTGLRPIHEQRARQRDPAFPNREHFGFEDGISQPWFASMAQPGPARDQVAAGEILLGYPNADGRLAVSPTVPDDARAAAAGLEPCGDRRDFGRDGTYLVLRQMAQDVRGFWQWVAGNGGAAAADRRAGKLMGRWRDGTPLVVAPDAAPACPDATNDFDYRAVDLDGIRCPPGSHVRRGNPRDALGDDPVASLELVRRHRILRRGRSYGDAVAGWPHPERMLEAMHREPPDGSERGVLFVCLNADIERQFEFVQERWVNGTHFAESGVNEVDPIVGHEPGGRRVFTVPARPFRERFDAGAFSPAPLVTVRGGEYFFLPGRRALAYLAASGGPPDVS